MSEAAAYRAGRIAGRRGSPGGRLRLVAERSAGYDVAGSEAAAAGEPVPDVGAVPPAGGGPVDAQGAVAALAAAVDLVARADPGRLTDRGLLEHTVAVDRQVTRLEAARGAVLAAVDRREAFREDACVTTASWWRWRSRRDFREATRMCGTARRLQALPVTRAALAEAAITWAHAEVIAGAAVPGRAAAIAEHEATLVALAAKAGPREVRRACGRIADAVDPDGSDPDRPAGEGSRGGPDPRRRLHAARLLDGLGDIRATLDPVTAERLERLHDAFDSPDPADAPADRRRSPAQRRHDAFDRILRAAQEHPDIARVHGARPNALVILDLLTVLGRDDLAARRPRLGSGVELDPARAMALLADAAVTPVLALGPWRPVAVGRRHRTLPAWLRPLLDLIHRTCRGPGCDRPVARSQAAHLTRWAAGGHTNLRDTIPACPGHHKLMDTLGWTVTLDPDTAICTWTSPDGHTTHRTHPPDP